MSEDSFRWIGTLAILLALGGAPLLGQEICDGLDNDGDGVVDESCAGTCASTGPSSSVGLLVEDDEVRYSKVAWNGSVHGIVWTENGRDRLQFQLYDGTDLLGSPLVWNSNNVTYTPEGLVWNGSRFALLFTAFHSQSITHTAHLVLIDNQGGLIDTTLLPGVTPNSRMAWSGSEFGVVYQGAPGLELLRIDAQGNVVGSAADLGVTGYGQDLAWSGSEYGIVYQVATGISGDPNPELYFLRFGPSGVVLDTPRFVAAGEDKSDAVLASSGSSWGVAWEWSPAGQFLPEKQIRYRQLAANGVPLTGEILIAVTDTDSTCAGASTCVKHPGIVWAGGEFGLIWREDRDGFNDVFIARLQENGTVIDEERIIGGQLGFGDLDWPAVAWTGDGYTITSNNQDYECSSSPCTPLGQTDLARARVECTQDEDGDGVDGAQDCDDQDPNNWNACGTCVDSDGDAWFVGCDTYLTIAGPDCDDGTTSCTNDCSDTDADTIPDCADDCLDADLDGYGIGSGCSGPDCDDSVASCTNDCVTDEDSDTIADCRDDCVCNTPMGSDVPVPGPGITLTFAQVDSGGNTTIAREECNFSEPDGFVASAQQECVSIDTTAGFTGSVEVCIDYSAPDTPCAFVDQLDMVRFDRACSGSGNDCDTDLDCGPSEACAPQFTVLSQTTATYVCGPDNETDAFTLCAYTDHFSQFLPGELLDTDGDTLEDLVDNCPSVWNFFQQDFDGDGFGDDCDCRHLDPSAYPGAYETNDGGDDQCPGDSGYGLIDEISGFGLFANPTDRNEIRWPLQNWAVMYEIARSDTPGFTTTVRFINTAPMWSDTQQPIGGQVLHYLVRPLITNPGSWGAGSNDVEREPGP